MVNNVEGESPNDFDNQSKEYLLLPAPPPPAAQNSLPPCTDFLCLGLHIWRSALTVHDPEPPPPPPQHLLSLTAPLPCFKARAQEGNAPRPFTGAAAARCRVRIRVTKFNTQLSTRRSRIC